MNPPPESDLILSQVPENILWTIWSQVFINGANKFFSFVYICFGKICTCVSENWLLNFASQTKPDLHNVKRILSHNVAFINPSDFSLSAIHTLCLPKAIINKQPLNKLRFAFLSINFLERYFKWNHWILDKRRKMKKWWFSVEKLFIYYQKNRVKLREVKNLFELENYE